MVSRYVAVRVLVIVVVVVVVVAVVEAVEVVVIFMIAVSRSTNVHAISLLAKHHQLQGRESACV